MESGRDGKLLDELAIVNLKSYCFNFLRAEHLQHTELYEVCPTFKRKSNFETKYILIYIL